MLPALFWATEAIKSWPLFCSLAFFLGGGRSVTSSSSITNLSGWSAAGLGRLPAGVAYLPLWKSWKSFDLVVYILGKKWKKLRFLSSLCLWLWTCHWTSILINSVRIWINISKFCHKYINLYQNQNHMIVHFIGNFIQSNKGLIHPFNTVLYSVLIDIKYSNLFINQIKLRHL